MNFFFNKKQNAILLEVYYRDSQFRVGDSVSYTKADGLLRSSARFKLAEMLTELIFNGLFIIT